jgi:hypothetical protein
MARHNAKTRDYQPRHEMLEAAKILGCDYSHLRRVVSGERKSSSLLNRYLELKRVLRANLTSQQNHTMKTDTEQTPAIP